MIRTINVIKKYSVTAIILVVASVLLTGCFVKQIYNVDNRTFSTEAKLPLGTVKQNIKIIGADRGWLFEDVAPGHMIGKIGDLKHNAKVDIFYTEKTFSLKYLDSYNLKKNNNTIHFRYNRWIEFFERDLVAKLGLASSS